MKLNNHPTVCPPSEYVPKGHGISNAACLLGQA